MIFKISVHLKQTDKLIAQLIIIAKRRTFHELNTLSLVRLMKSSTFGLGYKLCVLYFNLSLFISLFKCFFLLMYM